MKNIWVVAVLTVLSFAFVPGINAKDSAEAPQLDLPEQITSDEAASKPTKPEKKFSVRMGYGNGYKLGMKIDGKKQDFDPGGLCHNSTNSRILPY